jgi:hypothetical protein
VEPVPSLRWGGAGRRWHRGARPIADARVR